jgi:heptosyltransferase-2
MVKSILFMTLSNIGDCVLTLPVLDELRQRFPGAEITVFCGPRPKEIFEGNPFIHELIVYDKHAGIIDKLKMFNSLRKRKFDLIVDLRNSFMGAILPAGLRTSPFLKIPAAIKHMKDRHLYRVKSLNLKEEAVEPNGRSFNIEARDDAHIAKLLKEHNIHDKDRIVVVSPGARSDTKRWPQERFTELIDKLIKELSVKVVLVGDSNDAVINKHIKEKIKESVLDLSAKTNLRELAVLLKRANLLITNDSAIMHIASYMDVPIVAIFGITSNDKYGPWSKNFSVVRKEIPCRPCEKAQCKFDTLECLWRVKVDDVFRGAANILEKRSTYGEQEFYKRILIVRTDRIGDVLLSTPAIKALRDKYPHAYIAMMVAPYAKDIVDGNPYLDEVIIYDKDNLHKRWRDTIRFSRNLKKKRFDLSIVLHPTNRVHLITFLAGIPKRLGYDRKLGFLLTDRIKHEKQLGKQHESEYVLDMLRPLGISNARLELYMPIKKEAENWVEQKFKLEGIWPKDKILAIHPAASCPSKVWSAARFAQACDVLADKYKLKVILISGPNDADKALEVASHMRNRCINFAGKTTVSELASLLKRCSLFISNDSGPVHIASAVSTPVISIFGRNQAGLSPLRWSPLGLKDKILHKDIGCIQCLAHNCKKEFACLKAIRVEDVVAAADAILK